MIVALRDSHIVKIFNNLYEKGLCQIQFGVRMYLITGREH